MLILLRIIITGALIYVFGLMSEAGTCTHYSGDLTQAFYMAIVLVLAILMAAVWAPYLGERIATPLTGELTCGSFGDQRRWLPSMIRWFDHQGWRHATLWCCILEGLDHPDFPMPFTTGLRHTRSGSWWEKAGLMHGLHFVYPGPIFAGHDRIACMTDSSSKYGRAAQARHEPFSASAGPAAAGRAASTLAPARRRLCSTWRR